MAVIPDSPILTFASKLQARISGMEGGPLQVAAKKDQPEEMLLLLQRYGAEALDSPDQGSTLLVTAVVYGHVDIIYLLIGFGFGVDARPPSCLTPLGWAALVGNLEMLQCLIDFGADLDARCTFLQFEGYTPLLFAGLHFDHMALVQTLLSAGADPTATASDNLNLVLIATRNQNIDLLKIALHAGVSANSRLEKSNGFIRNWACSALDVAVEAGNEEAVQLLLSYGAEIQPPGIPGERGLLYRAAQLGNVNIVRMLLAADVNFEALALFAAARNSRCSTMLGVFLSAGENHNVRCAMIELNGGRVENISLLHAVAQSGSPTNIQRLLALGADIEAVDTIHRTPLHVAVYHQNVAAVQCILRSGAQVNVGCRESVPGARRAFGRNCVTALHLAAALGNTEIATMLLRAGARRETRADEELDANTGDTALHFATRNNQVSVIKILVAAGADINVDAQYGHPLLMTCYLGLVEACEALLAAGANVHIPSRAPGCLVEYSLPMHSLLYFRGHETATCLSILRLLLDAGSDINAKCKQGRTPLHVAAESLQNLDIVEFLLAAGADPLIDTDGRESTPLQVAYCKIQGNADILLRLQEQNEWERYSRVFETIVAFVKAGDWNWRYVPRPCPRLEDAVYSVWYKAPDELAYLFVHLEEPVRERMQEALRVLHKHFLGKEELKMRILDEAFSK